MKRKDLFWLTVLEVVVQDWAAPLLWAFGVYSDGNGRKHVAKEAIHLMTRKQKGEDRLGPTVHPNSMLK